MYIQEHKSAHFMMWCISIIISFFSLINEGWSADSQETLDAGRLRTAFWVGVGTVGERLNLTTDEVKIRARIDALPTIELGADLWGSERHGVYIRGSFGVGADLTLPPEYGGQLLSFNQHQISLGGQYRWHLSPRPLAPSLQVRLGLHGLLQSVPEQRPTFFVNRSTYGPEVGVSFTLPLNNDIWTRAYVTSVVPILFREDPADSGLLDQAIHWMTGAEMSMRLRGNWGLYLGAQYGVESVKFNGFGTRAQGVYHAETEQSMWKVIIGGKLSL